MASDSAKHSALTVGKSSTHKVKNVFHKNRGDLHRGCRNGRKMSRAQGLSTPLEEVERDEQRLELEHSRHPQALAEPQHGGEVGCVGVSCDLGAVGRKWRLSLLPKGPGRKGGAMEQRSRSVRERPREEKGGVSEVGKSGMDVRGGESQEGKGRGRGSGRGKGMLYGEWLRQQREKKRRDREQERRLQQEKAKEQQELRERQTKQRKVEHSRMLKRTQRGQPVMKFRVAKVLEHLASSL